jgi:hypothetical protein
MIHTASAACADDVYRRVGALAGLQVRYRVDVHLVVWTQRLLLTDELARAEPKRLRYRMCTSPPTWPFTPAPPRCACRQRGRSAGELAAAFARLKALPALA